MRPLHHGLYDPQAMTSMNVGYDIDNTFGHRQGNNFSIYDMAANQRDTNVIHQDQNMPYFRHDMYDDHNLERLSVFNTTNFGTQVPTPLESYGSLPHNMPTTARPDMGPQDNVVGPQNFQELSSSSQPEPSTALGSGPGQLSPGQEDADNADQSVNFDSVSEDGEVSEVSEVFDEEEEEEDSIDNGDFIVAGNDCSSHTEKPGTTREDNGFLEVCDFLSLMFSPLPTLWTDTRHLLRALCFNLNPTFRRRKLTSELFSGLTRARKSGVSYEPISI